MEQRPLRLGDIVDDYCPRERRVTNHAIVAMVEDTIKQTRCTACDADHPYKGGQAPRRRKAESTGRLYKEVLAGITDEPARGLEAAAEPVEPPPPEPMLDEPVEAVATAEAAEPEIESVPLPEHPADEGPVHRPLIRATLPRPEGVKAERPIPDFTVRHNGNRAGGNGNFRDGRGAGQKGRGNGHHRFARGPNSGGRNARPGGGFGGGRPGGRHQGPRKRSR
jgi:translation initiation factor IF-2